MATEQMVANIARREARQAALENEMETQYYEAVLT
jgi:hypothetical protein